jgi:hypothetical protein
VDQHAQHAGSPPRSDAPDDGGVTLLPATDPINQITDVIAFNNYFGWYRGKRTDWPDALDKWRAALPGRVDRHQRVRRGGQHL